MYYFCFALMRISSSVRLGDKRFSSNESLETISWGAVSERVDKRASSAGVGHHRDGRPRTPVKRPKSGAGESINRTPGSSSNFKLELGMSVFCNNELGRWHRDCLFSFDRIMPSEPYSLWQKK